MCTDTVLRLYLFVLRLDAIDGMNEILRVYRLRYNVESTRISEENQHFNPDRYLHMLYCIIIMLLTVSSGLSFIDK
jgi:hypothetical protein